MANKRKNRKRSSVKRKDYTQGGRVGYQEGDQVEQDRINAIRNNRAANRRPVLFGAIRCVLCITSNP